MFYIGYFLSFASSYQAKVAPPKKGEKACSTSMQICR
jgi:hypothetical protein